MLRQKLYFVFETQGFGETLSVSSPFLRYKDADAYLHQRSEQVLKMLIAAQDCGEYKGLPISKENRIYDERNEGYYSISMEGTDDFFCGHVREIYVPVKIRKDEIIYPRYVYLLSITEEFGKDLMLYGLFPSLVSASRFMQHTFSWQHYSYFGTREPDEPTEYSILSHVHYQLHWDHHGRAGFQFGQIKRIRFPQEREHYYFD